MKKFYKNAETGSAPGGYVVRLDGKVLKTPLQKTLLLPTYALATAIAKEWNDQKTEIQHKTLPLTQLANTLIDKGHPHDRREISEALIKYGSSDLLCYFADHPQDLVIRQEQHWRPLLGWISKDLEIPLQSTVGLRYLQQSEKSLKALDQFIHHLHPILFTAVQAATQATGSLIVALALIHEKISVDQAYQTACLEEIYQLEKWGADTLAQKRLDHIHSELSLISTFLSLAKAS